MTIDEMIKKYKDIANVDANCPRYCMRPCEDCTQECGQVAEWLEELKVLRLQNHLGRDEALIAGRKEGYNKAIDDFAKKMNDFIFSEDFAPTLGDSYCYVHTFQVNEIAEQLKAGERNGIKDK